MEEIEMKKIISIFLLISLLVVGSANTIYAVNDTEETNSQATVEDDFADDCVIVVINKENSKVNKLFTKDHFKGLDLTSIEDLSHMENDPDELLYFDQENFKQMIKVNLVKKGKKEVLKAVRKLEKLEFI